GAVTVTIKGDYTVTNVAIDSDMLEKDNQEMLQELLVLALNEGLSQITKAKDAINERMQG
ncbi:MAG: YbaB/EbfC family DNA-binding protein, partial [Bacteroidia bacterium]|nr:YbaB/EbfC family DNA-binding protein [Bacteroidia bacterium]